jgi:hypothetical protein
MRILIWNKVESLKIKIVVIEVNKAAYIQLYVTWDTFQFVKYGLIQEADAKYVQAHPYKIITFYLLE